MRTEFIDPGSFRHELVLETVSTIPDGAGGYTEAWAEAGTIFARIEPLAARSRYGADQTLEKVTNRVTLRHRDDLRSGMRLRRLERLFDIVTVHDPDETGRYLVCAVTEVGL